MASSRGPAAGGAPRPLATPSLTASATFTAAAAAALTASAVLSSGEDELALGGALRPGDEGEAGDEEGEEELLFEKLIPTVRRWAEEDRIRRGGGQGEWLGFSFWKVSSEAFLPR